MIHVSDSWKAVQKDTLLPETFVEITYGVTDAQAQNDAVVTANFPDSFSNESLLTKTSKPESENYSALDYGLWGLDGSFVCSDDSPENPGYVDRYYTGENAEVSVSPHTRITISFSQKRFVVIPGIKITWSDGLGGWATEFKVIVRNADGILAEKLVTGNTSVTSVVEMDMVEYTKIIIEVIKWSHPFQRPRCLDVRLGIPVVYTKKDLISYKHNQTVDLLSAALPKNEIVFDMRNDDGRWNPDNPKGIEKYLMERQEITVRYGMDINGKVEWIKGGTFWLNEWSTPANGLEASFTARDAIEFMGGIYNGIREGTLYDVAVSAFVEADLPVLNDGSARYIVDDSLQVTSIDFTEDTSEYTVSEVLQMVANAGECVFYQDRDGVVHVEKRSSDYSDYIIGPEISYNHPEYSMTKPLKAVSVSYSGDAKAIVYVDTKGEVQTVDNPFIQTEEDALRVGRTARNVLINRKVISGEMRADMRLDVLDNVVVISKYASNIICLTDVSYSTTGGAFKASYVGRVVSVNMGEDEGYYSGEIFAGEI
jgi:hypothetical protein